MAEFLYALDYDRFARQVMYGYRHILNAKAQAFIRALLDSSLKRTTVHPEGFELWRACRANDTAEQRLDGMGDSDIQVYVSDQPIPCSWDRLRPRREKAREGRVNSKGIPCLYLADAPKTALIEVRPPVGSYVTLAKGATKRRLRLVDFSIDTKAPENDFGKPVTAEEKEEIVWFMVNQAFSEPVNPDDDTADYAPTQIIAEAFRSDGLDGLIFKSSLGDGKNLALFDLDAVHWISREVRKIDRMQLEDSPVGLPIIEEAI